LDQFHRIPRLFRIFADHESNVRPFEPYCLRHTALTNLADLGCDSFTLAKIAGHSSITITQRYCHPQADAIERAFSEMANRPRLVTEGGHPQNGENDDTFPREASY
jgi:site-specific recombinase XerD